MHFSGEHRSIGRYANKEIDLEKYYVNEEIDK